MAPCVWNEWLPEELAAEIRTGARQCGRGGGCFRLGGAVAPAALPAPRLGHACHRRLLASKHLRALLGNPACCACCAEEPKRYAVLVSHLAEQWRRDKAERGVAAAAEATLPYVPLAKWCVYEHP